MVSSVFLLKANFSQISIYALENKNRYVIGYLNEKKRFLLC